MDLDDQFAHDRLATILSHLQYSSDDARNNHPNPSKVEIDGKYYEGLQSLKTAVTNYRRFMDGAVGASATKHAAEQEQTLANAGQNRRAGLRADDVRDKRIAVLRTDFKRGESAQRYAEMVALVQRGEDSDAFRPRAGRRALTAGARPFGRQWRSASR